MTRTDDIINVAGHRLSTGALEEVLACSSRRRRMRGLGSRRRDQRRNSVGPDRAQGRGAAFRRRDRQRVWSRWCANGSARWLLSESRRVVKRLPKTRSGKILRGTIKKIADGVEYRVPPTIDDPVILDEITADLSALGYPPRVG